LLQAKGDPAEIRRILESRPTIQDLTSDPALHVLISEILTNQIHSSHDIHEIIKREVAAAVAAQPVHKQHIEVEGAALSYIDVLALIDEAIKVYDADKIGKPDYALLSAGGGIIHSRTTPSYSRRSFLERLFYRGYSSPPSVILQVCRYYIECIC
jgi:SUN domain-containing protein 1/2